MTYQMATCTFQTKELVGLLLNQKILKILIIRAKSQAQHHKDTVCDAALLAANRNVLIC